MSPMDAIQVMAVLLICIGLLVAMLPVNHCAECPHCKLEDEERRRRRQKREHDYYHHSYGPHDGCPYCERPDGE